jgi:peptide/nickel transport system substrate-binding protein
MRKRIWLATFALATTALACGPSAAGPGPSGSTGESGTPKAGGILNVRVTPDPFNFDITFSKSTPNDDLATLTYSSLLGFKMGPDTAYTELILQPELAEKWEVSPDAKTFTFKLRPGAKFQNLPPVNGREITSADVKFSAEYRLRSGEFKDKKLPKAEIDYIYEGLDRVETPDKSTVVYHYKDAFVPFINYAASDWNPIFPREVYDADGHFQDKVVGSGPYMLDIPASQKGTRWVFKKNPDYWDTGKPYVNEIRWLTLPQESTMFAAFQTKQLDVLYEGVDAKEAQDVIKANPQAVQAKTLEPRANQIYLSQNPQRNSPVRDQRVRRAISYATDRDEINRVLLGGEGEWGFPGAMQGLLTEAEIKQIYRYDLNEAKRLLTEAGFSSGTLLEWPIPNDEDQANVSLAELLQAQWKKAGLNVELKFLDKADQRALRRQAQFDIDIGLGLGGLHDDPDSMQYGRYHSKSPNNNGHVRDPELDKMLEASRQETNPEKRRELMRSTSKYIESKAWTVELLYRPKWYFWQPYVKNYRPHFGNQADYWAVWLDK